MRVRKVEAAVQFANNPTVVEQQALGPHPFVDHGEAAIRRCRRGVEPVAISDARGPLRSIGREDPAAADPVDETIAAPAE